MLRKPGRPINHPSQERTLPKSIALYPAQWEWLLKQPGSVSSNIQRLIEEARKVDTSPR
jgi:hypothetical protein